MVNGTDAAMLRSDSSPPLNNVNNRPAERDAPLNSPCNIEIIIMSMSKAEIMLYSRKLSIQISVMSAPYSP
ncbi:hypothetical protein D3C77_641570 [compost metagenome]